MMPPTDFVPLVFAGVWEQVNWAKAGSKYLGFLAVFSIFGSTGLWLVVSRVRAGAVPAATGLPSATWHALLRRGAYLGVIGTALLGLHYLALIARNFGAGASDFRSAVAQMEREDLAGAAVLPLLLFGFVRAARNRPGWRLVAIASLVFVLRHSVKGRWLAMVNPLHEAAASLWLGTLFAILVVALPLLGQPSVNAGRRDLLVANLMRAFSPLALLSSAVVGFTGIVTAWVHLKYFAALWTTPYGGMLLGKLVVVAGVAALGAWNWRCHLPNLGTGEATERLRRSSRAEVVLAMGVLVVTALLVSLPSPKLPMPH